MAINPKSLKNLHPRIPDYEEPKTKKKIMITPKAWELLDELSIELGYRSRSALIEALARKEFLISQKDQTEQVA